MDLLDAIAELGWLQWLAVVFNILYVIYAALRKRICWIYGGVGALLLMTIYIDVRLYSDAMLQVFYLLMSCYGFVVWQKEASDQSAISIRTARPGRHLIYLSVGLLLTVVLGTFWALFDAALPYIDAATTAFSLVATYLVAQRYIENWIYWIVIDAVCVWVYLQRDLPLIALLFLVYIFLAAWGWQRWRTKQSIWNSSK